MTPCNNTFVLRCSSAKWTSLPCGHSDRIAETNGKHCRQPPYGLLTLNLRSHWLKFKRENKNKRMVVDHALIFGPPVGLEPTTPCNNPPASATLRTGAQVCPLRKLRGANIAVSRPSGCCLLSIRSRCSNSIEKIKTKKATLCVTFSVLAPPVGLEPTTP